MQMHIAPTRQVSELQLEFNNAFPFLRIEFFRQAEGSYLKHSTANKLPATMQVGNCQLVKTEGDITITEETKVGDLENKFLKEFSLNIQVFRRSGTIWLETTMTDKWTLKQQNDHGREISTEKNTTQNYGPKDYEHTRDSEQ